MLLVGIHFKIHILVVVCFNLSDLIGDKMRNIKNRICYIDIIKICAIFGVLYNHCGMYMKFDFADIMLHDVVSAVLSCLCKTAVPLFFMASGVLLLGGGEIGSASGYIKKILKICVVLVVFSFIYYLKMVVVMKEAFSISGFIIGIIQKPIFRPYWFLYYYISFLGILPLLQTFVINMSKRMFTYFAVIVYVVMYVFPLINRLCGITVYSGLEIADGLISIAVLPLLGYGLSKYYINSESHKLLYISIIGLCVFVGMCMRDTCMDYLASGLVRDKGMSLWIPGISVFLYVIIGVTFSKTAIPMKIRQVLASVTDCCLGIYLLDGFIGTGGRLDVIKGTLAPFIGELAGYLVEIFAVFMIRYVICMGAYWVLRGVLRRSEGERGEN